MAAGKPGASKRSARTPGQRGEEPDRGTERGSGRGSGRGSARGSGRGGERGTERGTERGAERGDERGGRPRRGRGRPPGSGSGEAQHDTRTRIQQVALEMFIEHGFDKTSLREIAEALGVTKAALYYHFRSKEEIISSSVQDYLTEIDELIAWAEDEPRTDATRSELLARYSELAGRLAPAMRVFQQNPAGMREHAPGQHWRSRMEALHGYLRRTDEPDEKLRTLLGLMAIHVGTFALEETELDADDRMALAVRTSRQLLGLEPVDWPGPE